MLGDAIAVDAFSYLGVQQILLGAPASPTDS